MANYTEALQVAMGYNERWGPWPCERRVTGSSMRITPMRLPQGKPVKVKSRMSEEDRARLQRQRERLDPKNF